MADTATDERDVRKAELVQQIKTMREREERARRNAEDMHRESVELWRDAQHGDLSYQDVADALGVTKGYVRKEVMRLERGEL